MRYPNSLVLEDRRSESQDLLRTLNQHYPELSKAIGKYMPKARSRAFGTQEGASGYCDVAAGEFNALVKRVTGLPLLRHRFDLNSHEVIRRLSVIYGVSVESINFAVGEYPDGRFHDISVLGDIAIDWTASQFGEGFPIPFAFIVDDPLPGVDFGLGNESLQFRFELLAAIGGISLAEAHALTEIGRENSTAMVVVAGDPPGRNVCALVRSLSRDRSRLIVVAQPGGLHPGSFERMLRASLPDCEKRIRVVEAGGSLVDMISSAERNKHYSPKQALEVFCDRALAGPFAHESTDPHIDFDPGLVSVRPIQVPRDDAGAITAAVRGDDAAAQHRVLDPHLFSNPEGMAEYKGSLMGESLLREFLSDVHPDREVAIRTLRDLMAAEVGDIEGLQYLGSGRNGSAYRHPDGFILKVTTDPVEARSAERLVGTQTEHIGHVYDIGRLSEGVWLIVQEDLGRLPPDLAEEFDLAMEVIEALGALDDLNEGRALAAIETVASDAPRPIAAFVAEVLRRFGVIGMCREMRMLGLTGDFHSGNVMVRGTVPVLTDLGTPGDDPGSEDGRRIDEFGTGAPGSGAAGPATMRGSNSSSWSNGRGALKAPMNFVPEDEEADEGDYALDWGPGRVTGASF